MTQLVLPEIQKTNDRLYSQHKRTLRVLHVVNGQHYAGAARVQDLLALTLPEFGYEVSFACLLPEKFPQERQSQASPLYELPMKHRLDFAPARRIAQLVQANQIDLLHSHETRSAMIASAVGMMTGVPFVHHVHCQMNTEVGAGVKQRINTSVERFACNRADHTIAVSGSIERFIKANGFDRTPITIVPNGVPSATEIKLPRKQGQPWTIGMVALLRERKGLETLMKALPALRERFDVRLRIVGPFESEGYLNRMYDLSDSLGITPLIDWTGFAKNVNEQIAQMDVLVLPSVLAEGMPMVLLEAMSTGVPIVGSQVDGITDVIQHEHNGLLFKPSDANDLACQLMRLMSNEVSWDSLSQRCRAEYQEKYSQTAMAAGVASVYNRVLKEREQHSAS